MLRNAAVGRCLSVPSFLIYLHFTFQLSAKQPFRSMKHFQFLFASHCHRRATKCKLTMGLSRWLLVLCTKYRSTGGTRATDYLQICRIVLIIWQLVKIKWVICCRWSIQRPNKLIMMFSIQCPSTLSKEWTEQIEKLQAPDVAIKFVIRKFIRTVSCLIILLFPWKPLNLSV